MVQAKKYILCLFSNKLSFKAVIAQMFLPCVRNNSLSSSMSCQRIYVVCDLFSVACKGLCYSEI